MSRHVGGVGTCVLRNGVSYQPEQTVRKQTLTAMLGSTIMELHPELKRRFARIAEVHPRLFAQMKALTVPFWWHASREHAGEILHNGTLCRIDTGQRVIGVTAHHVYDKYLEERQADHSFTCQFGGATVTPEERLIDQDRRLDLATFDLSGLSALGDAYIPTTWPPEPPKAGDLVMYGGVPGTPRHVNMETEQAHFLFDTITGLVTSVGFDSLMVRVSYGKLLDADNLDGEIVSTVGPGTSGGPVYRIDESGEPFDLELVGFIAEADNVLLARHAKLIRADGTIER